MQSFTLDPNEQQEVTYISGIAANGTLAAQSFWTWNNDDPATYGSQDDEAKYGALLAGAGSGEITFSFNASSNWTASEQSAFEASMALWSEVANVHFEQVATGGDFTITRGSDGSAEAGTTELYPGTVGGATLGQPVKASLSIDTSVGGFGPLGGPFNEYGGYPWITMIHELGHILGLGHSGAYDEGVTTTDTALTPDDTGLSRSCPISTRPPIRTTGPSPASAARARRVRPSPRRSWTSSRWSGFTACPRRPPFPGGRRSVSTAISKGPPTAGHVYVFAADHAAVELDGLSGGVAGVTTGQLLAA